MQEHVKSLAVREHEAYTDMKARDALAQRLVKTDGNNAEWSLVAPSIISKTRENAQMATEALKSTHITNLDASPMVQNTAGAQGPFVEKAVDAYITTTTGVTVGSTYRMLRLATKCYLKSLIVAGEAMTQGPFDIGAYYSDGTTDGTPVANQGLVIDADRWGSAVSFAAAVQPTDIITESGVCTVDKLFMPLWQMVGLSADPGGFIDVVFTSTNTITAGGKMYVRASYADGA